MKVEGSDIFFIQVRFFIRENQDALTLHTHSIQLISRNFPSSCNLNSSIYLSPCFAPYLLLYPPVTTNTFSTSLKSPNFQTPHVNLIMSQLSFCVSFISLKTMILIFNHAVVNSEMSSLLKFNIMPLCVCTTYPLPTHQRIDTQVVCTLQTL